MNYIMLDILSSTLCAEKFFNGDNDLNFLDYFTNITPIGTILSFIISLSTAYLAYQCNKKNGIIIKIVMSVFAFLFSGIYLIYYLFAHVLFGNNCKTTPINLKKMKNTSNKLRKNLIKKGKKIEKKFK